MIAEERVPVQQKSWQELLTQAVTDPAELLRLLDLDPMLVLTAQKAAQLFALRVPHGFINRMKKRDPNDPLLRQVLPMQDELRQAPGFQADPLGERQTNPIPGLLHKYHGRVLLILSGACGVNCRYCFRREFPYNTNNPGSAGWEKALAYIQQDPTITEVILSGGDPLVIPDRLLRSMVQKISAIPHIKTLRIHSRMPIVLPERITPDLLACLTETHLRCVLVLHTNHAQEIDETVCRAIQQVRNTNITLLNQSVLLRGVNDSAAVLIALSERLFDMGVLPYYLHLLDKVSGAAHFDVDEETARALVLDMMRFLPGYLVPRLVREEVGAVSKVPVGVMSKNS
jgi:EF-P beta-lysylation protein EpmB